MRHKILPVAPDHELTSAEKWNTRGYEWKAITTHRKGNEYQEMQVGERNNR